MQRMVFGLLALLFSCGLMAQQGVKLGAHGSLPITDEVNSIVSLAAGIDVGYMHALGEVVDLGLMAGYIHGFPEKFEVGGVDLPSIQFLPIAASLRFWFSNSVSIGVDGGYALGLNDGNEGGVYYKPILGYLFGTQTEINLSYTGISSDGLDWATVNFGILYTFPQKYRTRY